MSSSILSLFACLLLVGCAHRVTIETVPSGAKVSVDGRVIGRTPVTFEERSGYRLLRRVEITKLGYQAVDTKLQQEMNWALAVMVTPFTLGIGVPFSFTLKDRYVFKLRDEPDLERAP